MHSAQTLPRRRRRRHPSSRGRREAEGEQQQQSDSREDTQQQRHRRPPPPPPHHQGPPSSSSSSYASTLPQPHTSSSSSSLSEHGQLLPRGQLKLLAKEAGLRTKQVAAMYDLFCQFTDDDPDKVCAMTRKSHVVMLRSVGFTFFNDFFAIHKKSNAPSKFHGAK